MPLASPAPRRPMHTRAIECRGYEREDGLWDIEAHLTDTKTYVHLRREGGRERQAGEPIHDMWLRVTIDLDMKIHAVEAVTDSGPYARCGDITPGFGALVGLTIGVGWRRGIAERVGGVKGCTHLVELLGPLGTTAFQATGRARQERAAGKPVTRKPYQLNSCHVYQDDSPAVLERWPDFYTGALPAPPK
ncbi:MAG: DUF2889 domain-containing protein [Burkholderiales bacterium]|nr:DUF2889 domain-containing protein [Burkholderiales bacterium]